MQVTLSCPHCHEKLITLGDKPVEEQLKELRDHLSSTIVTPPTQKTTTRKSKEISAVDRMIILKAHKKNWKDISKKDLAIKLGYSIPQISAVHAWTKPTLAKKLKNKSLI